MINVRVCCGLSVGIYTPGRLHLSRVTSRNAVACRPGSHPVCTWYNPGSHPDMPWPISFHMIYSRITPRYAVLCRFAHDLLQGHTQICCGLSVCTWFTLGHTQWCCDLAVSTWFTPGSHPDMLCSVGLHMIYSRVTPRYAVVCRFPHDLLWVTPSDAVVCTRYNPGSHPDMLYPAIRGHTRFAHDIIQGHTQICCGLSVCTRLTPGSHPEMLYGLHIIYPRVKPRYAVAC